MMEVAELSSVRVSPSGSLPPAVSLLPVRDTSTGLPGNPRACVLHHHHALPLLCPTECWRGHSVQRQNVFLGQLHCLEEEGLSLNFPTAEMELWDYKK